MREEWKNSLALSEPLCVSSCLRTPWSTRVRSTLTAPLMNLRLLWATVGNKKAFGVEPNFGAFHQGNAMASNFASSQNHTSQIMPYIVVSQYQHTRLTCSHHHLTHKAATCGFSRVMPHVFSYPVALGIYFRHFRNKKHEDLSLSFWFWSGVPGLSSTCQVSRRGTPVTGGVRGLLPPSPRTWR